VGGTRHPDRQGGLVPDLSRGGLVAAGQAAAGDGLDEPEPELEDPPEEPELEELLPEPEELPEPEDEDEPEDAPSDFALPEPEPEPEPASDFPAAGAFAADEPLRLSLR
jgi:hypothetical protein